MSQANVEIVRNALAAFTGGDSDHGMLFIDPEVVIDATRNVFNPGTHIGIDGFLRWRADTEDIWEDMRLDPLEFLDAGDRVVVIGQLTGKGRGSGVEVNRRTAFVATVREGRIVRMEIGYTNPTEALEAVGLSE